MGLDGKKIADIFEKNVLYLHAVCSDVFRGFLGIPLPAKKTSGLVTYTVAPF